MRVGIFGGTFDPPHIGHINMCKLFLNELNLDILYVIPAHIPPHKTIKSNTSADDRFKMSEIAFSKISDKIIVSDIEMKRNGKSYTADTIKSLKKLGYDDLYFLCGTDMLLTLDKWYNPEYILKNASIVCVRRETEKENDILISDKIALYKEIYNAKVVLLDTKAIEISSSEVRQAFKLGNGINDYVTNEIKSYIIDNNLYKDE